MAVEEVEALPKGFEIVDFSRSQFDCYCDGGKIPPPASPMYPKLIAALTLHEVRYSHKTSRWIVGGLTLGEGLSDEQLMRGIDNIFEARRLDRKAFDICSVSQDPLTLLRHFYPAYFPTRTPLETDVEVPRRTFVLVKAPPR